MKHPFNRENLPEIPEARSNNYIVDVFTIRGGAPVHRVNEATIEELRDMVCFYHSELEEVKKVLDAAKERADKSLGYEEL